MGFWKNSHIGVFLGAWLMTNAATGAPPTPEVDRIEGSVIFFKAHAGQTTLRPLETKLFDIRVLGQLVSQALDNSYLVISARPCNECGGRDREIYLARMTGGLIKRLTHPGRILDPKTTGVLLESRAFFGKCLQNSSPVYIAFQRDRVDRRSSLQPSVFIAEPAEGHLHERLLERGFPKLKTTLALVKQKNCFEVSGINRLMNRKLFEGVPERTPTSVHPK